MAEVQAIVTDIDNTFLYAGDAGQDVIPQSHIQAARIAEEMGLPVLLVSSRSLALTEGARNAVGLRHSAVLDNGASVYDFGTGEYVAQNWLPEAIVREVAATIKPHATLLSCEAAYKPMPANQLDPEQLEGDSPSVFAEYEIANENGLYVALGMIAGIKTTKPMHTTKPGIRCVQITLPGVDKFSGVKIMLAHEDLEGAPVLVLGDNTNDEPLFAAAPEGSIKVLMGSAPPQMHGLANRPLVGTAKQEGWGYAVRRYAIEPRRYGIDDRELRPAMSPESRDYILSRIDTEPLADATLMNELVTEFESPEPIDPWRTVDKLARALGDADSLLNGDLDILRPLRGIEHAGTVLSGAEDDYIPHFRDAPPIVRVVARLANMCGDIGKVLSVADTGHNFAQSTYNRKVTANLLRSTRLPEYAKRAIEILVGQDIIGGLLQGRDGSEAALADLRQNWPVELAEYFDDLLLAAYLSDASAHSEHRQTLYGRSGQLERAIRPDDAQLTFLFEKRPNGQITLTPDRAKFIIKHLPGLRRLRNLC